MHIGCSKYLAFVVLFILHSFFFSVPGRRGSRFEWRMQRVPSSWNSWSMTRHRYKHAHTRHNRKQNGARGR